MRQRHRLLVLGLLHRLYRLHCVQALILHLRRHKDDDLVALVITVVQELVEAPYLVKPFFFPLVVNMVGLSHRYSP